MKKFDKKEVIFQKNKKQSLINVPGDWTKLQSIRKKGGLEDRKKKTKFHENKRWGFRIPGDLTKVKSDIKKTKFHENKRWGFKTDNRKKNQYFKANNKKVKKFIFKFLKKKRKILNIFFKIRFKKILYKKKLILFFINMIIKKVILCYFFKMCIYYYLNFIEIKKNIFFIKLRFRNKLLIFFNNKLYIKTKVSTSYMNSYLFRIRKNICVNTYIY